MIGQKAPSLASQAVVDGNIKTISLDDFNGKYKVIFFYPKDFTYVCPTELHAFQDKLSAFQERNVAVIGCSVDSCDTHLRWLATPKKQGGIQGVTYPLIADENKEVTRAYGVLDEQLGVAFRGLFLLDKNNVVQSLMINNLSLGRNIDEVIRLIDALQCVEKCGQVCPANWTEGQPTMKPDQEGLLDFFK